MLRPALLVLSVVGLAVGAPSPVRASDPPELSRAIEAVRSGRTTTGAIALYDLLRSKQYPEEETRMRVWLAVALDRGGLEHSARVHLRRAVRRSDDSERAWRRAVTESVALAVASDDPIDVLASLRGVELQDVPRSVRADVAWWRALAAWDDGDLREARDLLEFVGVDGPRADRSRYLLAVLDAVEGRPNRAARGFKHLLTKPLKGDAEEVANLRKLARLGMARLAYADGQFDASARIYRGLPRLSPEWAQGVSESTWALLRADASEHLAMGQLITLQSPFLDETWLPETGLLEALAWYSVCDYRGMSDALDTLEGQLGPIVEEVEGLVRRRDPVDLYVELYAVDAPPALPPALYARLESDRRFAAAHGRVLRIQHDRERLAASRSDLRDGPLGRSLRRVLVREDGVAVRRAGRAAAEVLTEVVDETRRILAQGEGLRFESLVGQKDELMELQRDPDVIEETDENLVEISYATDPRQIYWPFAGEYWRDELGFYQRVVHSSCEAARVR